MDNKIVHLATWKQCNNIEEDYLRFLSHLNKYLKVPTNVPELVRNFYFILRYLEGSVNALDILSLVKPMPQKELEDLRLHIIEQLDEIKTQLMKY